MPGVKRKASFARTDQRPIKLKKQSTSVNVDKAVGTLKSKKSTPKFKPAATPKETPKPKKVENAQVKPPLPMPRFPTLKPQAALTGFNFNFYKPSPAAATDLKRDETVILTPKPAVELPPGTKATEIERTVKKLHSGSFIGRIMNCEPSLDEDTLPVLPSHTSLAVYETPKKSTETQTGFPDKPIRQSAFDVANFFGFTDDDSSSSMPKLDEVPTIPEEEDGPPVLSAQSMETVSSDGENSNSSDDEIPKLLPQSPAKTPSKSPRKMTGGVREIVFSFDTTGSMYNFMEDAKDRICDILNRLNGEMPGIRLAFIGHGDYYDLKNDRYLIKWIDFGASIEEVVHFFEHLPITHGGDADECYELVLQKVRQSLSWSEGSQRSLVMIGDSDPHELGYTFEDFVNDIDWKEETQLLNEMGVRIYGVQIGYTSNFYREISKMTGGAHLRLENASFTCDTLMSICLREGSLRHLKGYENEVRAAAKKSGCNGGSLDLELERLFSSLKNIEDNKSLKQRARENKIKDSKLKMLSAGNGESSFTSVKSVPQKRPSEDTPSTATPKKQKTVNGTAKHSEKTKSVTKPASLEKTKKTMKIKTPAKKEMKSKSPVVKKSPSQTKSSGEVKKRGRPKKSLENLKTTPQKKTIKTKTTEKSKKTSLEPKSAKKVLKKSSPGPKKSPGRPKGSKNSPTKTAGSKSPKTPQRPKKAESSKKAQNKPSPKQKASMEKKKSVTKLPAKKATAKTVVKKKEQKPKKSPAKSKVISVKSGIKKSSSVVKTAKKILAKSKEKPTKTNKKTPVKKDMKKKLPDKKKIIKDIKKKPAIKKKVEVSVKKKAADKKKSVKDIKKKVADKKKAAKDAKKKPAVKKVLTKEKKKPTDKKKSVKEITKTQSGKKKETKKSDSKASTPVKKGGKSPVAKASPKAKSSGLPLRENITNSVFNTGPLSNIKWTPWETLVSYSQQKSCNKSIKGCSGYCNSDLYKGQQKNKALHEVAVVPPSGKKYPVLYLGAAEANFDTIWKNFSVGVKREIDRIVKLKGCIVTRQGLAPGRSEDGLNKSINYIKSNFDYAWKSGRGTEVVKDSFVVSKPHVK